jgi:hypothetical protein
MSTKSSWDGWVGHATQCNSSIRQRKLPCPAAIKKVTQSQQIAAQKCLIAEATKRHFNND